MVKEFVKTFKVGNCSSKFVVEIVITGDERNNIEYYEAWLHNTDCSIKTLLFGCDKLQMDIDTFQRMIMRNISHSMAHYLKTYMKRGE